MPAISRTILYLACALLVIISCMVAGCSSAPAQKAASAQPGTPAGNTVMIKNFAFDPPALTVKAVTTVTWTNQDPAPHIVVSDAGSPVSFASGSLASGDSFTFTFTQAGSYPYHCSIHPAMKGTIVVE